ncbi:MAG: hypothetical protein A2X31_02610 [Elusimicrobia bacterium GWB2_63_22]|nr:MAG: hypothetical protein A2X31_02610 [Elusimicrobia bacterium GWB2_63_22]
MKRVINGSHQGGWALLAALCIFAPPAARSADLAAVLASDAGPYGEAYAAFRAELKRPADVYDASKPGFAPPEDVRFVAAFGARAVAAGRPPGTRGVYALAPVVMHGRGWHQVSMVPAPEAALAAYRALQPGLRRLAVFWSAYPGEEYLRQLRSAGARAGVEIISAKLKSPDSFPDRLRRLLGRMDAFWLMPDPALITTSSLLVLSNFSCANSIPFYAPTPALMHSGATASLAPDFAQSGAAAAAVIESLYMGEEVASVVFVEHTQMKLNEALIGKCRWPIKK